MFARSQALQRFFKNKNDEISGCGLLMTEFTSADGLFPHARI